MHKALKDDLDGHVAKGQLIQEKGVKGVGLFIDRPGLKKVTTLPKKRTSIIGFLHSLGQACFGHDTLIKLRYNGITRV